MKELLRKALEQLEIVKKGNMPSEEGKRLIGKINFFKSVLNINQDE